MDGSGRSCRSSDVGAGVRLLGVVVLLLAYLAFFIGAINVGLDWWHERERKRMGLGCWFYTIGILRRVK